MPCTRAHFVAPVAHASAGAGRARAPASTSHGGSGGGAAGASGSGGAGGAVVSGCVGGAGGGGDAGRAARCAHANAIAVTPAPSAIFAKRDVQALFGIPSSAHVERIASRPERAGYAVSDGRPRS